MDTTAMGAQPPSPPIGSLGRELVKIQSRSSGVAMLVGFGVGSAGPWLMFKAVEQLTQTQLEPTAAIALLWIAALVCIGSFVVAVALFAFLPSLLMGTRDRQASATHAWIGARETRRYLGSASAAGKIPTTPEAADVWLVRTADTLQLRPLRFEVTLLARRFDEARRIVAEFPRETPFDEYRVAEANATIDEQEFGNADLSEAKEAMARIPRGIDRSEAIASMAVFEARRLVGRGDWRIPLISARAHIPGSDWSILTRDLGLPMFQMMLPKVLVPLAIFIVAVAAFVSVRWFL